MISFTSVVFCLIQRCSSSLRAMVWLRLLMPSWIRSSRRAVFSLTCCS